MNANLNSDLIMALHTSYRREIDAYREEIQSLRDSMDDGGRKREAMIQELRAQLSNMAERRDQLLNSCLNLRADLAKAEHLIVDLRKDVTKAQTERDTLKTLLPHT